VKQLLENYDKTLRPVRNVSTTTFIGVHAELILITSITEATESISFVVFLAMVSRSSLFRIFSHTVSPEGLTMSFSRQHVRVLLEYMSLISLKSRLFSIIIIANHTQFSEEFTKHVVGRE
jgi:hypothetical protein